MPRVIGHDGVRFEVAPDDFMQKARVQKRFFKELKKLRKKQRKEEKRRRKNAKKM